MISPGYLSFSSRLDFEIYLDRYLPVSWTEIEIRVLFTWSFMEDMVKVPVRGGFQLVIIGDRLMAAQPCGILLFISFIDGYPVNLWIFKHLSASPFISG